MKRGYKLQEFVAHSSNVNCLKIGKKSSRVVVTGGEDHKVNLWAIGKPNSILSLSGHTSPVESVTFDSSEILVVAGASSGTIKLWDLEEAKIVRTLTGHRSNCISVDFHPFGEFFASGSLDTNLKIWDIRRKGCIHTYKGHSRGVNAIKFTPDGRWVVSGGEDNVVKLWDLTAGKLLHDFKCHEGTIQCIDFHPHEFLLATGSADRTVKFWDLETFELIGSAGPEATGVRSMVFNPDGRTLFCGLHESLKVFSWEPVRCHDAVDMGWSRLADLNIHEGKLLGCSFNQSCVGVWVADISRIAPYAVGGVSKNGHTESKPNSRENQPVQQLDSSTKTKSSSPPSNPDAKEIKSSQSANSAETLPRTPQRVGLANVSKVSSSNSTAACNSSTLKRNVMPKIQCLASNQVLSKSDVVPVIIPRNHQKPEQPVDSKTESALVERTVQVSKSHVRKPSYSRGNVDGESVSIVSGSSISKGSDLNQEPVKNFFPGLDTKDDGGHSEGNATSIKNVDILQKVPKLEPTTGSQVFSRPDVPPVVATRNSQKLEQPPDSKTESTPAERTVSASRSSHVRRPSYARGNVDGESVSVVLGSSISKGNTVNREPEKNFFPGLDTKDDAAYAGGNVTNIKNVSEKFERSMSIGHTLSSQPDNCDDKILSGRRGANDKMLDESSGSNDKMLDRSRGINGEMFDGSKGSNDKTFDGSRGSNDKMFDVNKGTDKVLAISRGTEKRQSSGRTRTLVESWEKRERSPSNDTLGMSASSESPESSFSVSKGQFQAADSETTSSSDEDDCDSALKDHGIFSSEMQSRLTKLQVVRRFWDRNDIKGAIFTMEKMSDYSVHADVISVLMEKFDAVTLDICACMLPLLTGLLCSKFDRHVSVSLDMLVKLVRTFGPVIHSTVSGPALVGVDLHAEERLERCNQCFAELQKIKQCLTSILRKGGLMSRAANELNLAIQEV
ncbi:katanin p80 WD40 repeat-containing subunit B1 homolog KTN80.4-like isoform X1 [Nymphaea colorata]|nr:katanin p80 WD40 repeat-containing subunit B1 homolog KTN80.4-like isoform X1 [Nymphaea colorata]